MEVDKTKMKFTMIITDKAGNVELLSGNHDDPDRWVAYDNCDTDYSGISLTVPSIRVELVTTGDEVIHIYKIKNIDELSIQVFSDDLTAEFSEEIQLDKLVDTLIADDDCTVISDNNGYRTISFEIVGELVTVKERPYIGFKKRGKSLEIIF